MPDNHIQKPAPDLVTMELPINNSKSLIAELRQAGYDVESVHADCKILTMLKIRHSDLSQLDLDVLHELLRQIKNKHTLPLGSTKNWGKTRSPFRK